MTAVNAGEILCIVRREEGVEKPGEVEAVLRSLPADSSTQTLVSRARRRGSNPGKISYADCFASALASKRRVPLLTGDPEFRAAGQEIKSSGCEALDATPDHPPLPESL